MPEPVCQTFNGKFSFIFPCIISLAAFTIELEILLSRSLFFWLTIAAAFFIIATDFIKIGIFLVLLYTEYLDKTRFINYFIVFSALSLLAIMHLGCQEILYNKKDESMFLALTKNICVDPKHIGITRYFGTGTVQLFIAIVLIFY